VFLFGNCRPLDRDGRFVRYTPSLIERLLSNQGSAVVRTRPGRGCLMSLNPGQPRDPPLADLAAFSPMLRERLD